MSSAKFYADSTARNLLHRNRVHEFLEFCRQQGLQVRPGRGDWQIAQIQPIGSTAWHVLYERRVMPEHVTVPKPLIALVKNFISQSRRPASGRSGENLVQAL